MCGTHYAGKSNTLKAAATMAHCAKEGYSSTIEASAHNGATRSTNRHATMSECPSSAYYFRARDQMRSETEGQIVKTNGTSRISRMDFTDVGIRHTILNSVQLHHFFDCSPSVAVVAKEARFCIIAIVVGWITTRVISGLCDLNRKQNCSGSGHCKCAKSD